MTTTIVTRSGKGSPLTNTELDANFTNLKTTADAALPAVGGTISGSLIITSDLEVRGTTTSIDSTTVEITDLNITLAKDATNNTQANGAGITIAGSNAELKYVSTGDKWTLNKNLSLADSIKLTFGNDGDLEIYHDGSNSIIADTGTGGLNIRGSDFVKLQTGDGAETMVFAQANGTVQLKFDNSTKLATTSVGIEVSNETKTGYLKAIGNIPSETSANTGYFDVFGGFTRIISKGADGSTLGGFSIIQQASDSSPAATALSIDTSSNATFSGSVTSTGLTVNGTVDVNLGSDGSNIVSLSGQQPGRKLDIQSFTAGGSAGAGYSINATSGQGQIDLQTTGTTALTLDSSQNVNIPNGSVIIGATTAPNYSLDVDTVGHNSTGELLITGGNSASNDYTQTSLLKLRATSINPNQPNHNQHSSIAEIRLNHQDLAGNASSGNITFFTNPSNNINSSLTQRMVIDSAGNLIHGTTNANHHTGSSAQGITLSKTFGGLLSASRSGAQPLIVNRQTSDGITIDVRKNGTSVGGLGVIGGDDLYIAGGSTGLRFDSGVGKIYPTNGSGTVSDNTVDIGEVNYRFKDLHLSGSISSGVISTTKQITADEIQYPLIVAGTDVGNTVNQTTASGIGLQFKLAGNSSSGDSLIGASIAAMRESDTDSDSSTGLAFLVSQNDTTLDEALRIDHDANIGIGTSSPDAKLRIDQDANAAGLKVTGGSVGNHIAQFVRDIGGSGTISIGASGGDPQIQFNQGGNLYSIGVNANIFEIADSGTLGSNTRFAIDGSGNILVGTTSSYGDKLNINGTGHFTSNLTLSRQTNDSGSTGLILEKTRNTSVNGNTVVQAGDQLGYIAFRGNDGDQFLDGAFILSFVDGTPSNNDMPTNLQFWTTSDGASSPSERVRIDSSGNFTIKGSNADLTLGATGNDITFNRNSDNYINAQAGTSSNIIINPENRFVVNTADTERLRLDSSGRLIIATTSTSFSDKLYINNSMYSTGGFRTGTASTYVGKIYNNQGKLSLEADTDRDIQFGDAGTAAVMYIDNSAETVGIGTTSPTHTLQVHTASTGAFINRTTASNAANLAEFSANRAFTIFNRASGSYLVFGGNSARTDIQATDLATSPTAKNIHLNPHGGNVGIGTGQTAPETKLHVNSGTGNRVAKFESTDATAYIQVADSNTTNSVHGYGANGDELSIYANGAERIRVDSDGRVAIGNSNPTDKLHVESSENGGVQIQVDNPNTGNASYAGLYLNGQGNNFFLKNWGDAVSGKSNGTEFLSTAGSSFFMFSTANAEKMRLTATGDLGINTTAPDSKLHIAEDAFDQTIVKLNFSSADSSAGNYAHFGEIRLAGHSTNCNTAIRSYSNAFQNSDGALAFWTQEHGGSFDERMRILGDGKIGIGTASPSFKVDILEASGNGLRIKAGDETADVALSVGSAGTADKFVIQAGGNVGVGTSSPALSLHVAGAMRVDSTDGIAARIIRSSYFSSSQNLELASGASANIILTTSKVGIGTTSPDYPLSVTGAARFRVDSSSTVFGNHAASIRLQNKNTTDNNYAGITFDGSTNTAGAIQFQYTDQSGSYGDITFESRSASGFSEKMRIKSTGEVGIGTTDPDTAKLVVQGADAGDMLHLHGLTGTDTRGLKISLSNEGATNQVVNYDSLQANGKHVFKTAGTERLRITDGGDVSIGSDHSGFSGWRVLNLRGQSTGALVNFEASDGTRRAAIANSGNQLRLQTLVGGGIITFETGAGVERARIDGAGALGIGTTSPNTKVDLTTSGVHGLILNEDLTNSSASSRLFFKSTQRTNAILNLSGNLEFRTGATIGSSSGTVRMLIDGSNGNLAIGHSSPTSKVDIRGSSNAVHSRGQLYIANTDTAAINNGSQISLGGTYTGTNDTFFASIAGRKENSTDGNYQGYLQFATRADAGANTERVRINSSGNVLIGKTADNDTDVGVRIQSNGGTSINRSGGLSANVINTSSGFGLNVTAGGTATSGNWAFRIEDGGGNAFHHFFSDAIGIGTSSPTSFINTGNFFKPSSSGTAKFLTIDGGTSAANIILQGNITGENPLGGIYWTSTNGQATGNRQVAAIDVQIDDHSDATFDGGSLRFFTKPAGGGVQSPRMTLLANGNLIVGTTNETWQTVEGLRYFTGNSLIVTRDSAEPMSLNRLSNDGHSLILRKDGTGLGSIGVIGSDIFIGSSDTGLRFISSLDAIVPANTSTPTNRDNAIDLGTSAVRFQDAHFAGTINTRALTVENDISGDATLRLKSTSSGDPTLIFNSSAANRSGMIKYQDNGTNVGRIEYVHSADRIDIRAGSATGITASVINSAFLVGKTAEGDTDGIHFKTDGRGFFDYDGSGQNVLTLGRQSDGNMIQFNQANSTDGTVGSISVSNNATIYATSSDARLKSNIEDADDSGETIDAIKVRQYDWKSTGKHQNHGMIAQELQKIVPEAVSGDAESEEMMGIDYSKLVPMLVKEIQSLRQRVAQLEE